MKRRITDCTKPRRVVKRHKLPELSAFVHGFKLFFGWFLIMFFDCISSTRIEYLWPLYMCIKDAITALDEGGLVSSFSFIFGYVCMDAVFFYLVPLEWLYAVGSMYIWMCYVSNADKGCSSAVGWTFLSVAGFSEGFVRLTAKQHIPMYEMFIFKPLASHSVTFAVSSSIRHSLEYIAIKLNTKIKQHLRTHSLREKLAKQLEETNKKDNENFSDAIMQDVDCSGLECESQKVKTSFENYTERSRNFQRKYWEKEDIYNQLNCVTFNNAAAAISVVKDIAEPKDRTSVNEYTENGVDKNYGKNAKNCGVPLKSNSSYKLSNTNSNSNSSSSSNSNDSGDSEQNSSKERRMKTNKDSVEQSSPNMHKDNYYKKLEAQLKKFKLDLQISQQVEENLRNQVSSLNEETRGTRSELLKVQRHNDELQTKLHNLVSARQSDKHTMNVLRKELSEERKQKCTLETQCADLKNDLKKKEPSTKPDCTERCKMRRQHLEVKNKCLKTELESVEKRYKSSREEISELYQYKEKQKEMESLVSTIAELRQKTDLLESSLRAETRIKLDLFSALGEVRRKLTLSEEIIQNREKEVSQLKARLNSQPCPLTPLSSQYDFSLHDDLVSRLLDPRIQMTTHPSLEATASHF